MSVLKVYNATKGKWEFVDTVSTGIIPSSVPLVDPKHDQLWLDTSSNDFQGSAINAKLDDIVDNLNLVDERTKLKYSFVGLSSNILIATETWATVGFPLLISTDSSFYNPATPDRLIVPHGVSKIKFSCQVGFGNHSTGVRKISVSKNDTEFKGITETSTVAAPTINITLNATSPIIDVYEGDYFKMNVYQTSGINLGLDKDATWFSIEAVE